MPLIWEDTVLSGVALKQTSPWEHPTSYLALQLVAVENNQSVIRKNLTQRSIRLLWLIPTLSLGSGV